MPIDVDLGNMTALLIWMLRNEVRDHRAILDGRHDEPYPRSTMNNRADASVGTRSGPAARKAWAEKPSRRRLLVSSA